MARLYDSKNDTCMGNLSTRSLCELRIYVCPQVLSKIHVSRKAIQYSRSYLEFFQSGGPDESYEHWLSRLCASQHRLCLIVSVRKTSFLDLGKASKVSLTSCGEKFGRRQRSPKETTHRSESQALSACMLHKAKIPVLRIIFGGMESFAMTKRVSSIAAALFS